MLVRQDTRRCPPPHSRTAASGAHWHGIQSAEVHGRLLDCGADPPKRRDDRRRFDKQRRVELARSGRSPTGPAWPSGLRVVRAAEAAGGDLHNTAGRTQELAGEVDRPPQRVPPSVVATLVLGAAQHETRRYAEFICESLDGGEVALKRQSRDVFVRDE
jgi:hypothetical protein